MLRAVALEDSAFKGPLERALRRVDVPRIVSDAAAPIQRYLPGHPDADETGMVAFPRVNVVEETTAVMNASRSYQANLAVMRKVRAMSEATMRIGR